MSVDSKHPDYEDRIDEWTVMRDTFRGGKAVKDRGQTYLPMPSGFTVQPDAGEAMYLAYKLRAQFPSVVRPMVRGMTGIIHRMEAQVTLPPALEPLREAATADRQPLDALHRRITAQLLTTGRYALLADAPEGGSDVPFIAGYTAESLINWSDELDFFVLDETAQKRLDFSWQEEQKYRVLRLTDGSYTQELTVLSAAGQDRNLSPRARGGLALNQIPLVVIGTTELSVHPEDPPLLEVAEAALAAYRLDADLRYQLYMSGQETLFCYGVDESQLPRAVGAGVVHGLPEGANAEYVGPSGVGIQAHERAIERELDRALSAGARVFDSQSRQVEAAEALRLRFGAQTATLVSVAKASAAGLERALRFCALFVGANPEEVKVEANLRFLESQMTPHDAEVLMKLWMGRALSKQDMFWNFQRGGIVPGDKTFEKYDAETTEGDVVEDVDDSVFREGPDARGDNPAEGGTREANEFR